MVFGLRQPELVAVIKQRRWSACRRIMRAKLGKNLERAVTGWAYVRVGKGERRTDLGGFDRPDIRGDLLLCADSDEDNPDDSSSANTIDLLSGAQYSESAAKL